MTTAAKADPRRQKLIAKVHVAKKQLGIDDPTYRALVARHGKGKESAGDLSVGQLIALVEELKAKGWADRRRAPKRAGRLRPVVNDPQAKVRALWVAAYHLGVVSDASEEALAAFVKRQAKVEALQWLRPDDAPKVVEALKAMMRRGAGVDWSPYRFFGAPQDRPKARILEAQWRILNEAGVMHRPGTAGLCAWLELSAGVTIRREAGRSAGGGAGQPRGEAACAAGDLAHVFVPEEREAELDRAITLLGKHVRAVRRD